MESRRTDALKRRALSLLHHVLLVGSALVLWVEGARYSVPLTLMALMSGWIPGSFIEYVAHRFVLHELAFATEVHAHHHASPAREQIDPLSYWGSPVTAVLVWLALRALTGEVSVSGGITAGLCLQYSWFRSVHRRMHKPGHRLATGALAQFHRGHHLDVHTNFGVTMPVWDALCGTRRVG